MLKQTTCAMLTLILFSASAATAAADDSADVPRGEVIQRSFKSSKIFPGTERDYAIYVPKQYDPEKPACVHVNQDGVQFKAPEVFDRLIHEKKLPVIIGVFIKPGVVKAESADSLPGSIVAMSTTVWATSTPGSYWMKSCLRSNSKKLPTAGRSNSRSRATTARSPAPAAARSARSRPLGSGPTRLPACSAGWERMWACAVGTFIPR